MVPIRLSAIEANRARQVGHDIPMTDNVMAMTGETSGLGHESGPGEPGPAGAGDLAGSSAGTAADHPSGESAGAPDAEPADRTLPRAPYGSWTSPISAAQVAGGRLRVAFPIVIGETTWWQEDRPDEAGRTTIVRRAADDSHTTLLPAPWSARNRVHEYGGLSYLPVPGPTASATLAGAGQPQRRARPPRRLREPRRPAPLPRRERRRVRPGRAGPADPGPDRPGQRDDARRRARERPGASPARADRSSPALCVTPIS